MADKTPKCELDGSKWNVQYQKGNSSIVVEAQNNKETVNIFSCEDSVVQVKGKVTNILVNGCTKVGVVFEDVISQVEVVRGKKIQVQATGSVPTIQVDKSEGVTLYLTTANKAAVSIITSLSSEINVVTPGASESDDPKEQALPQQFVSTFSGDKLVTVPAEHVGV
ncbi:suppressor of rasval19 [Balamuthia mandrillaris]